MKRESFVFLFGLLLIVMPFMGIPSMWKQVGYVALGAVLALVGYQLRRQAYMRSIEQESGERKNDVYVESVMPAAPYTTATPVAEANEEALVSEQEIEKKRTGRTRRTRTKQTV